MTAPQYRPCPDQRLCQVGDACAGRCSQGQDAAYVMGEALRTGECPMVLTQRLNEQRGSA